MKICECGICEKEVTREGNKYIIGHNLRIKHPMKDPEVAKRHGDSIRGRTKESHEGVKRQAEKILVYMKNGQATYMASCVTEEGLKRLAEIQKIRMLNGGSANATSFITEEGRKRQAEWMKNGGAAHIISFIRDDSKPENELFIMSCKLLPRPIHKFPIYRGKGKRNYNVDIADSSLAIILEFDGWYHFNTKEEIERDKRRQKEIEEEGWKFIRYNIFQPFPTLEQVKEDIKKVLEVENVLQFLQK
jgi:very-short-patch-repair endonuclease